MTMIIKGLSQDAFTKINETFGGARWYVAKVFCDTELYDRTGLDVTIDLEYVTVSRVDEDEVWLYRAGWTAKINQYDFVKIEII